VGKFIEIENVGPIERARFQVPEHGGVLMATGGNGVGKTHILDSVNRLVSGQGEITVRDGASEAVIRGLGVTIHVARRPTQTGECDFFGLEGPDPSVLVDPHIKKREAAHAERVRALCKLSRAEFVRTDFVSLAASVEEFERIVKPSSLDQGDLPSIAAAIKRDFEAAARIYKGQAENLLIEAKGIAANTEDVPETESPNEEELRRELAVASSALGELLGRQTQADQLRKAAASARQTLDSYGDKGTAAAGQEAEDALEAAKLAVVDARGAVEHHDAFLTDLRKQLAAAEAVMVERKAQLREAEKAELAAGGAVEQAFADFQRRKQLAQAVKDAESAATVDQGEIDALTQRQTSVSTALNRAGVVCRAIRQRAQARELSEQAGLAMEQELRLREAARGCERVLTTALAKVLPEGMFIENGFVMVHTDRGAENFDELSEGERWDRAVRIGAASIRPPGILVCREGGWRSMQPSTQVRVARLCKELNIVLIVEVVDDGDLRFEEFDETTVTQNGGVHG
jgi:hypothetical protein